MYVNACVYVYVYVLRMCLCVCEMLQNHLNQCIVAVRANCSNGYLEAVTEEREEDTEKTCNQGDQRTNSRYQTTVLNSSLITSSNHDGTLNCPIESNGQLKTEIRIKKDY
ncbi:unnamed protein product [Onchocerca ochengi]|uniref:Ig-like domain-containing protein n=1 Tax=Onchocerca ochengi TaxID=42157 RepID=A0A182EWX0_ONCOC|nr:unnamed protein product [Onchocerca ochengi]